MKTIMTFNFLCLSLICFLQASGSNQEPVNPSSQVSSVLKIGCTAEVRVIVQDWTSSYEAGNRGNRIELIDNNSPGASELLLGFSDEYSGADKKSWHMTLGREAVVVVTSSANLFLKPIKNQGIRLSALKDILENPDTRLWSQLIEGLPPTPVQFSQLDCGVVKGVIARISKPGDGGLAMQTLPKGASILAELKKNSQAVIFCRLSDIVDNTGDHFIDGMVILPIDKNSNGSIDAFEDIYATPASLKRGAWIGKYPLAFTGPVMAYSDKMPANEQARSFLLWVLNQGQEQLEQKGYIALTYYEQQVASEQLLPAETITQIATAKEAGLSSGWQLFLVVTVILGVLVVLMIAIGLSKSGKKGEDEIKLSPSLNERKLDIPAGLFLDRTHTWAFMETNGLVRIGIDDFLLHLTGKITRIKMKENGDIVKRGDALMTIVKDGKQLKLYSPVSGVIHGHNHALEQDASLLNAAPYSKGWVYEVEPGNWIRETSFFMMGERCMDWLTDEFAKLKDFFAESVASNSKAYVQVVIQDGGEIVDQVLGQMGPEVWEDFQTQFLDVSR